MFGDISLPSGLVVAATVACTALLSGCVEPVASYKDFSNREQLFLVSSGEMQSLSNQSYSKMLADAKQQGLLDADASQVQRLERIMAELVPHTSKFHTDAKNWSWEVHVININELAASVMPGGKIIFYNGLIEQLELTDDEIAAAMSHEMAHALREHTREKISLQMMADRLSNVIAHLPGYQHGISSFWLIGKLVVHFPHARMREMEADKIGLELMAQAGYDPNAAVTLWRKIESIEKFPIPTFLNSHPDTDERINAIHEMTLNLPLAFCGSRPLSNMPEHQKMDQMFEDYVGEHLKSKQSSRTGAGS